MTTDMSERGLEDLFVQALTGRISLLQPGRVGEPEGGPVAGGSGWILGDPRDYDRAHCVDVVQLRTFLGETQPDVERALAFGADGPTRRRFLTRLSAELRDRGVSDVLRHGIKDGAHAVTLYWPAPTPGNEPARLQHVRNRFSVTRQLRYSADERALALDLCLFVNGLPVFTLELKNKQTGQRVLDGVRQYQEDRDPREPLFGLGRCVAHFALDEEQVRFCPELKGKASWFLPFNRGFEDGAGNPPNPAGIKTDYLWKQILTPAGLSDILEHYAQITVRVEEKTDPTTGKKTRETVRKPVFPRYHQLDVVRELLADAASKGTGQRYLIQHSAGSGKSNSIAWLAHQLVGLRLDEARSRPVFDVVIVLTDRRILDQQIRDTIKDFVQVGATFGHASSTPKLRELLASGKKIITTTLQKFPHVLDAVGGAGGARRTYAIVIDEAHSSQGGKTAGAVSRVLGGEGPDRVVHEVQDTEDLINVSMEARKLLRNASYFAFTATPKNRTLEAFGTIIPGEFAEDGAPKRRPFLRYTMKQAIQEEFILDVLAHYTPVRSYYRLAKSVSDDPEFDSNRAGKKLRRFVEGHDHAVRLKAEIMVDHFHDCVLPVRPFGEKARAMVVCNGVARAVEYYFAFTEYLAERNSPWKAIVAFSGDIERNGVDETEDVLNGFPSSDIPARIKEEPYRFLICADKFQTGYDEPLLQAMYVDKTLSDIKAVQTLSRLNRSCPGKKSVFVLDFMNDAETIKTAFDRYYRVTTLGGETDPNKLHDLKRDLDRAGTYTPDDIERVVESWLRGQPRPTIQPILDACALAYTERLDANAQIAFKGNAKAFVRTYAFLAAILPWSESSWERLYIFLGLLLRDLPTPEGPDGTAGLLDAVDMDSYRTDRLPETRITPDDACAEIDPVPVSGGGHAADPEIARLSHILEEFNRRFGGIEWGDTDRLIQQLATEIPERVLLDVAYNNARLHADPENARVELDRALAKVMAGYFTENRRLFDAYHSNPAFKGWLADIVFRRTRAHPP